MIVSASYKTDIPAFYGEWFLNRLRAGFARMRNPRTGQAHHVPLTPEMVDGFVFWTRNVGPFLPALREVRRLGVPFVVHYTITGYARALERAVPEPYRMVALARQLAGEFGADAVVWRYDPIVFSSLTPGAHHLAAFARRARALEGATDEVVISFAHIYRKTRRNLDRAAAAAGFTWWDESDAAKRALTARLAPIAAASGMRLSLCAQPGLLAAGAVPARCIDAARLSRLAGRPIAARAGGNRPGCACHAARDIGAYESCPHGCVYCYAVARRERAQAHHRAHQPGAEFLVAPGRAAAS